MDPIPPTPAPCAAGPTDPSEGRGGGNVHAVARLCRAPRESAWALLTTAAGLARWNLGMWHTREVAGGLVTGESLFSGGSGFARIEADAAAGVVRYAVGAAADALVPRIEARVHEGGAFGHPTGTCLVTLLAWRPAGMEATRWQRLKAAHEVEIDLIRGVLESAAGDGGP
ncbi:MAG: hypothetical protein JNL30_02125 [Rubrivivax sp.]|nr:hypothetical protein [Rubrivivax sp.]